VHRILDSGQIEQLGRAVSAAERVLLTGPADADGDSLGASLALARGIRAHYGVRVDVAGARIPTYEFLPDISQLVPNERVEPVYGLVVVMDGDKNRLAPRVEAAFLAAETRGIIDHHGTTGPAGYDIALIEPSSASTCEMVLEIMEVWGAEVDHDTAAQLYTGILFDTGGFRYSNTGPETHAAAARLLARGIDHSEIAVRVLMERSREGVQLSSTILDGAEFLVDGMLALGTCSEALILEVGGGAHDLGGVVEDLLYIEGVEISALLVEKAEARTKISFRSRGRVDVAQLARSMSPEGGGHAKAAGVTLDEEIALVRARLPSLVIQRLGVSGS